MPQTKESPFEKKFERRHYEAIRRHVVAPAIGRIGLEGAREEELRKLKNRRKTELQSTLAEGIMPEQVRSVIDTHYVIDMVDDKLVAEDGEPIANMLQRALDADKELAGQDEFFRPFLVEQTQSEIDELQDDWEPMARGETDYNTSITFSGYREEYDDGTEETHAKLKRAGQKPYWRRGMFRVAHAQDGQVHIFNYSIDNCSVELMAEVARQELGYEFEAEDSTALLGERIRRQIDDDSWRFLGARLVASGDKFLGEKYGGTWKHGYNPIDGVRRAQAFVESQTQIVDSLLRIDEQLALKHSTFEAYEAEFELKLYDCWALLETRLDLGREDEPVIDYEAASSGAGNIARAEGKTYDACGLVITAEHASGVTTGQKTGFESLLRLENKKIKCPECSKKVVVAKEDLDKGHLYCKECGYDLDVCTGAKSFRKVTVKNKASAVEDKKETDWQRIVRLEKEKKAVAKKRLLQEKLAERVQYGQEAA